VPALSLLVFLCAVGCKVAAGDDADAGKYQGPCALAVAKDGKMLYVAGADACKVLWVELPGGKIVRRIAVPAAPTGLALSPDGKKLVVACAAPRSMVAVFATASGKLLGTVPVGHTAMSPTISPDGRRLYVCNRFNNDVSVVDLDAGKEVARVRVGREPIAAAITPDGKSLLVANLLPLARTDRLFEGDVRPVVTVVDARTHETAAIELAHGANGLRGICVTPDGKFALVTHLLSNFESLPIRVEGGWINTNVVSVIDLQQRKVLRVIGMDAPGNGAANPWDVACTADGKFICVSLAGTHELCVIETADLLSQDAERMTPMMGVWPIYTGLGTSLWWRVKLPGKGPRGLAIAGSQVYAAQYFSDTVAAVELPAKDETPVAASIALGPSPQWSRQRLGEVLFHDATICYQQWQSCASCHPDARIDGLNWDLLNDGEGNPKNTKSLLLAHRTEPAMWEGVRTSAKEAVRSGIEHVLFARRPEQEAAAIDAYLESLRPVPSPHLIDGRLGPAAVRGRKLFESERSGCARCHPAPLYTDLKSHDVGTRRAHDRTESFDTPNLVEAWRTAPYLHDGRYTTMKDLFLEGRHGLHRGSTWSERDIDDLVEYLLSL
jgi:YVTN family beta-propeller protein